MAVSNDVEDPQPLARTLSSRSDSVGQRHDRADEQQHKVGFHFLSPRPAIAPNFRFRLPETVLSPIYSARRKWLCADCHCWCGLASSRCRRSPTSSELARKRGKRGNIATALAFERANFPDGDDSRLGLTTTYVRDLRLDLPGSAPPALLGR